MNKDKERLKISTSYKTLKSSSRRKKSKVIGEGGFGCVLSPNVTCKLRNGSIVHPNNKLISKLMDNDDFNKEYHEIRQIMSKIKSIPNYKSYFLIDIHECKLGPLTSHDLSVINKGCKYFKEASADYIHNKTNSLLMQYAGKRVDVFIKQALLNVSARKNILHIHDKLVKLTSKGIKHLNLIGIYHCDIKLQNILYHRKKLRLIDWGFSYIHQTHTPITAIPKNFKRYPLHFNMPITVCMFSDSILSDINMYISDKLSNRQSIDFYEFGKYVWNIVVENRYGHYSLLESNYSFLRPFHETKNFDQFAIDIYSKVLERYTSITTQTFHSYHYFNEFYLNNVDIIGIAACYVSFMRLINNNNYSKLLWRYYETYLERISMDDFISDIKEITL